MPFCHNAVFSYYARFVHFPLVQRVAHRVFHLLLRSLHASICSYPPFICHPLPLPLLLLLQSLAQALEKVRDGVTSFPLTSLLQFLLILLFRTHHFARLLSHWRTDHPLKLDLRYSPLAATACCWRPAQCCRVSQVPRQTRPTVQQTHVETRVGKESVACRGVNDCKVGI